MRAFARASLVLLLAGPAGAAVLTVGPAGQFPDIQDAIDAASPGDVILVEPGTYDSIVVPIPLRILGDGSGTVIITAFNESGVVVSGIGAGEEVVLSGVEVQANPIGAPVKASILLQNNAGTVVLHDIAIDYLFSQVGVYADASERVLILASQILKAGYSTPTLTGAVTAVGSEVWIADSTITGREGVSGFVEPGSPGVKLTNATMHVWRSTIRGGDASNGKPAFFVPGDGGHGIDASASSVTLFGGPAGEVSGGDGVLTFVSSGIGGNGVRLANGSLARIQDQIPITGGQDGGGATSALDIAFDGSSSYTLDPKTFPTLVSAPRQVATGAGVQLGLAGSPSSIAVLFVSFETGPTLTLAGVEGFGVLNPALFLQLGVTQLDPTGAATLNPLVPAVPALLGSTFFFQFAEAAGAQLAISNPALVAVTSTP